MMFLRVMEKIWIGMKGVKVCLEMHEIKMAERSITRNVCFFIYKTGLQGQESLPLRLVFLR
jgi:hypothetical protein